MDIREIGTTVMRNASLAGLKVREYSPELCLAGGVVTGIAAIIFACKATLKADEVLDQLKADKEKIKAAEEANKNTNAVYTEADKNRDMAGAYARAAIRFGKIFAPAIALEALSFGFFTGMYGTLKSRNFGLIAACTALDDRFMRYRRRVVEKEGEDADREYATGLTKKKVNVETVDKVTGERTIEEKEVLTMDNVELGDWTTYDRVFSKETSVACETYDVYVNERYLRMALQHFNWLLDTRGYVYLSEVYEHLGFKVTAESRLVGWILDPANPRAHGKIKFADTTDGMPIPSIHRGTEDILTKTGRVFRPTDFYLSFNIDGAIWNLTDYWTDKLA